MDLDFNYKPRSIKKDNDWYEVRPDYYIGLKPLILGFLFLSILVCLIIYLKGYSLNTAIVIDSILIMIQLILFSLIFIELYGIKRKLIFRLDTVITKRDHQNIIKNLETKFDNIKTLKYDKKSIMLTIKKQQYYFNIGYYDELEDSWYLWNTTGSRDNIDEILSDLKQCIFNHIEEDRMSKIHK